jgi:hypothetical protein
MGATVVFLENDCLSEDVAAVSTILIEVAKDHTDRFVLLFPDLPKDGNPEVRLKFAADRKIAAPPGFALPAKRLVGLRRPLQGETYHGEAYQGFHARLKRLRDEATVEFNRPAAKRPRKTHRPSLGGITPLYMLEA